MEDHQGDGTRIFVAHFPCRAFLRGPHNSAACEEQNDNTSRVYPQTQLVGLAFSKRGVSRVLAADTVSTVESRSRLEPHRLKCRHAVFGDLQIPGVLHRPAEFIC